MSEPAEDVQVRRARLEEVQPLAAVYRQERHRASLALEAPPLPSGALYWIAERDGQPLGYAAGTLRPEGLVLGPVYVEPAHRRGGVASRLLGEVERWATDARIPLVEVSVAADNADGVRFLETAGFRTRRLLMARDVDETVVPLRRRRSGGQG